MDLKITSRAFIFTFERLITRPWKSYAGYTVLPGFVIPFVSLLVSSSLISILIKVRGEAGCHSFKTPLVASNFGLKTAVLQPPVATYSCATPPLWVLGLRWPRSLSIAEPELDREQSWGSLAEYVFIRFLQLYFSSYMNYRGVRSHSID